MYFGDYNTTETVRLLFNTFGSSGQSITVTDLAAADVKIHKDGGTTERSSANGITVSTNFDGVTGQHMVAVDLSDNSDAGFYAAGSRYQVRLEGITVNGQTLNVFIGTFSIGCSLRPSVAGRTLVLTSTGAARINWADIENTASARTFSNTVIEDVNQVVGNVGGNVTGSVASVIASVDANVTQINSVAGAAVTLAAAMLGVTTGTFQTGSLGAGSCTTSLGFADDELNGRTIVITSGSGAGQAREVTDFANTNGVVTFDENLVTVPANGDTFIIV